MFENVHELKSRSSHSDVTEGVITTRSNEMKFRLVGGGEEKWCVENFPKIHRLKMKQGRESITKLGPIVFFFAFCLVLVVLIFVWPFLPSFGLRVAFLALLRPV